MTKRNTRAIEELKKIGETYEHDAEKAHFLADKVLTGLVYWEVKRAYNKIEKGYA